MCYSSSYDRDYLDPPTGPKASSGSGFDYSAAARRALSPIRVTPVGGAPVGQAPSPACAQQSVNISPLQRITCTTEQGIVVVLDVTGSMRDAVLLCWDKIPVLYSQLVDQEYVKSFSISLAAVGDVTCDKYPVQVAPFLTGVSLDEVLKSLIREGGGGSGINESYELLAYYYATCVVLEHSVKHKPFLFFVADEAPRSTLSGRVLTETFGGCHSDTTADAVFAALRGKYQPYALCTPYRGGGFHDVDHDVMKEWRKYLPETTLSIEEPMSVVDVMLGIIAVTGGTRSIDSYLKDMADRNQKPDRVDRVRRVLSNLFTGAIPQ